MTEDEIAKALNPKLPNIYGVTIAPTTLYFQNGEIKLGYFQHTKNSDELKKKNTFTFIEFGNAQEYRVTNDNKFVTEVNGDDLFKVFYPQSVVVKFDQVFGINANHTISPKLPVRVGGVSMTIGVRIGNGVFIGGINLFDYKDHELEGYIYNGMFVINRIL
jgi:hypothetical protein